VSKLSVSITIHNYHWQSTATEAAYQSVDTSNQYIATFSLIM